MQGNLGSHSEHWLLGFSLYADLLVGPAETSKWASSLGTLTWIGLK